MPSKEETKNKSKKPESKNSKNKFNGKNMSFDLGLPNMDQVDPYEGGA